MREKYRKRLLIYVGILFCLISLVGVSYAVFNGYASQSSTNSLAATCVELVFSGENSVNLTNAYPISTADGLKTTPYTFKIKNNCENYMQYTIIASVINTTNVLDSKFVRVALDGDDVVSPTNISVLKKINTPASLSGYSIKENFVLSETMGISKNEEKSFKFRMWLDGDSSETWTSEQVEGMNYQLKISVVAAVKSKPADDLYIATLINGTESDAFPTTDEYDASVSCTNDSGIVDTGASISWRDNKWKLAIDDVSTGGTTCTVKFVESKVKLLADAIKGKNNKNVGTVATTPGSQPSLATEAVLASAADDYGTSYYFRGAVENNYVEYADMCWRIVRVLGDGTVRLTLYNYNGLTSSNTTSPSSSTPCNVTDSSGAYARYTSDIYKSAFNTSYNANVYIGFMYGNVSGSTYALTHANTNKSPILTNLESWYTNVLSKTNGFAESQLADAIWCNDKTLLTGTIGGVTYSGNGVGTNVSAYGSSRRLMGSTLAAGGTGPSFKCPTDNSNLSRFTVSNTDGNAKLSKPIGLLTADEIAYAGSVYGNNSSGISDLSDRNIYLTKNAGSGYRSMTPYDFNGVNAIVFTVDDTGLLQIDSVWDATLGLRPSIVLVNTVLTNDGDGTATNPYKLTFE